MQGTVDRKQTIPDDKLIEENGYQHHLIIKFEAKIAFICEQICIGILKLFNFSYTASVIINKFNTIVQCVVEH